MTSICAKLRRILLIFTALGFVLSLVGCAILPGRDQIPPQRIAGLLEVGADNALLQPCGQNLKVAVANPADVRALFMQLAQPGQTALFVDMTARPLADGRLQPLEIVRMQTTGRGCADESHMAIQWVARGETPDWTVLIGAQGMHWLEKGMASPAEPVPVISEEVPGISVSFQTLRGNTRELWLSAEPCFERSSGDYFHRTARFLRNGKTLTGCAYQGLLP